jgi:hypothetical protein
MYTRYLYYVVDRVEATYYVVDLHLGTSRGLPTSTLLHVEILCTGSTVDLPYSLETKSQRQRQSAKRSRVAPPKEEESWSRGVDSVPFVPMHAEISERSTSIRKSLNVEVIYYKYVMCRNS